MLKTGCGCLWDWQGMSDFKQINILCKQAVTSFNISVILRTQYVTPSESKWLPVSGRWPTGIGAGRGQGVGVAHGALGPVVVDRGRGQEGGAGAARLAEDCVESGTQTPAVFDAHARDVGRCEGFREKALVLLLMEVHIEMSQGTLRAILNFTPGPQGWISPLGVNTLYCLEEWRGEQRISPPGDNFTPRGQIHPWGTTLPLGVKVCPKGEVNNGPQIGLILALLAIAHILCAVFLITEVSPILC
jgi:hypothetical protein